MACFPIAGPGDVDAAVCAARKAFGGYGQWGMGREGGRTVIAAYTEAKTVILPFTNEML